jgi:hypothetical protein
MRTTILAYVIAIVDSAMTVVGVWALSALIFDKTVNRDREAFPLRRLLLLCMGDSVPVKALFTTRLCAGIDSEGDRNFALTL